MYEPDSKREIQEVSRPRSSAWPWVVLVIVLTPLLMLIIAAVLTLGGVTATWHMVNNLFAGRLILKPDQTAVITQVRELGRLETAVYTIEKVVEGRQTQGNPVLDFLLGDRLLFIAHGEVYAGVDLTQLMPEDVQISEDGRSVTVRLPSAEILTYRLDNDLSRVYDRQTGLLTRGNPDLESKVRQEAELQILTAACQGGILKQAGTNAEVQVRALLQLAHFSTINFAPGPASGETGCESY